MNHQFDYLLDQVNQTIMKPSAESLRTGVLDAARDCIRMIGIKLVCNLEEEEIDIIDGRYRFPDRIMGFVDFRPVYVSSSRFKMESHEMPHGARTGDYRYEFHRTAYELIFPNLKTGKGILRFYSLYTDSDDEIIIQDEIYTALKLWCEWRLLTNSNNPNLPRWPERNLIKSEAYTAVFEARGNINETNRLSSLR